MCFWPCFLLWSQSSMQLIFTPEASNSVGHSQSNSHRARPDQPQQRTLASCRVLLTAHIRSGGHATLNLPNAFTWHDPVVESWVNRPCHCVVLAACQFSLDISKHWMFACSHDWFVEHASQCPHESCSACRHSR